ncbi:estradiol 17-beta-dehydrogenase 8-like [Asterias rubens]|uniref:estradiol 17-beta-dehydrogenase 8-like n=1 Tax=Asterias rubens TaxID=7604 RepID=UPI001455AD40|nr:estradiol 17-beta-dehydrogenase 8-like [Asterias rubens]
MAAGLQLAGKVAIVTGGGSGIGRAVCELFARHGASVVTTDIDLDRARTTLESLKTPEDAAFNHQFHQAFALDVSNKVIVRNLVKHIAELYKEPASVLVNCAGITKDKMMLKMDEEKFDEVININLKGTFLVTQAVSQEMIDHRTKEGAIVNIASIVGKSGNIGQCNYAASKAGVVAFTQTTAKELARFGIRCNVVLPGFIKTPMTDAIPENVRSQIEQFIPLQRQGEPSEVAEACLFLASKQSSYMTGSQLEITGGLSM